MCEITRKWMGIGYEQGMNQGIVKTTVTILKKKLGFISENIIEKISNRNEDELNYIVINIFDIDKEEDILKYIHYVYGFELYNMNV